MKWFSVLLGHAQSEREQEDLEDLVITLLVSLLGVLVVIAWI